MSGQVAGWILFVGFDSLCVRLWEWDLRGSMGEVVLGSMTLTTMLS